MSKWGILSVIPGVESLCAWSEPSCYVTLILHYSFFPRFQWMFMENISRMKSIIWTTPCGAWGSYFSLYAWGLLPAVLGTHWRSNPSLPHTKHMLSLLSDLSDPKSVSIEYWYSALLNLSRRRENTYFINLLLIKAQFIRKKTDHLEDVRMMLRQKIFTLYSISTSKYLLKLLS